MSISGLPLVISANGNSAAFQFFVESEHAIQVRCDSWGSSQAALQFSLDGTNFDPVRKNGEPVVFTENDGQVLEGNIWYRFATTNYSSPITITGRRVKL